MSHVVITELGFQATPDVTVIDTTWIQLARNGSLYGGVPKQAAITLRCIAAVLDADEEASSNELLMDALREVSDFMRGAK